MDDTGAASQQPNDWHISLDVASKQKWLIRRDQLDVARQGVGYAIPVNVVLGLASTLVAVHAGQGRTGAVWFLASTTLNGFRILLQRAQCSGLALSSSTPLDELAPAAASIKKHLQLSCFTALLSGVIWAFIPILCAGYTSPQATFYIAIICGITAGAATHGISFALIPACFITPPILSLASCLLYAGGFDRIVLAGAVLLYLFGILRGVLLTENGFRETSRLKNEAGELAHSRALAHASAKALAEEMRHRATHDDLSGLLNRAGFVDLAEQRLVGPATTHCLMLLDLDGFKSVNDVYGHKMGDRVLVEVARRLRGALPPQCLAGRIGGDEFAILFDPSDADMQPDLVAARLIRIVAEPFENFDAGRLGMSVGVHHAPEIDLAFMMSCADEALYAAKSAGRNRFRIFDAGLHGRLEVRRDSERDLPRALADNLLEVWFQPIFGQTGEVVTGLEALVRWKHPVHGWIPPGDLIAAAAMAGLTEIVMRFILEQVSTMIQALHGLAFSDIRVAMNISPREMAQLPVDDIILRRLGELNISPSMLAIEITEETALDIDAVRSRLTALSEAGIRVALDDFGNGYSSLASLRQLRAKQIKIDRSLVTGLSCSDDKRGMVQAVLGLGRSLSLDVVAEGVETADDLSTLKALGCEFMQGYHLGRPAPLREVIKTVMASRVEA